MLLLKSSIDEPSAPVDVVDDGSDIGTSTKMKKEKTPKVYSRVKKDAIWKTLLRMMRKYYQDLFVEYGLGKGKDHWPHDKRMAQTLKFINTLSIVQNEKGNQSVCQNVADLDLPAQKLLMSFILLLFTTKHKNPPVQLKAHVKALLPTYWKIFNNNNDKLLRSFFSDPLLKKLWCGYPRENLVKFLTDLCAHEKKLMLKDFRKYNIEIPQELK
jgi:hypothetical protein